jgi:hypothetical protein
LTSEGERQPATAHAEFPLGGGKTLGRSVALRGGRLDGSSARVAEGAWVALCCPSPGGRRVGVRSGESPSVAACRGVVGERAIRRLTR